ncbi:hypothetical protein [Vacuolonema iberomarrocanum]|uniref:hypothetical protein n=1 Tax=Vacuolonema iberomarrocanum TaxID=3454632 RepID=UPI0019E21270|nr:hypothetical protein [filamentous cyanobacterium LEGE 07170]
MDLVQWPLDGDPATFSNETLLLNAMLGGVMVGWAALMYFVAAGPIALIIGLRFIPHQKYLILIKPNESLHCR